MVSCAKTAATASGNEEDEDKKRPLVGELDNWEGAQNTRDKAMARTDNWEAPLEYHVAWFYGQYDAPWPL